MSTDSTQSVAPIEARGLSKTYRIGFAKNRLVKALQGLDLVVPGGQVFGLLGPNGAGKSTTIKILMNLVTPSAGTALLFGQPASSTEARRQIGFLPENPAPYEYLTGREFVTLAGRLSGLSGENLDRRVTEVLGSVELGHAERLQIRRYSKGMVQRVALAQALVGRPRLLILDEPTSGLDPIGRSQMRDLIFAERERGTTILFCSHIIPDVEALCERMAILVGGRVVQQGSVHDLTTDEAPHVLVEVRGVSATQAEALEGVRRTREGEDWVFEVPEDQARSFVERVWHLGGSIRKLAPKRASLEDVFMNAVKATGRSTSVGGEIQT